MAYHPIHPRTVHGVSVGIGALLVALFVSASAAVPDTTSESSPAASAIPDSSAFTSGTGVSYWGTIPSATDSTTTAFNNRGRKAWEWALTIPYSVINLPLRYIRLGIGGTVGWLDRRGLFQYINIVPVPKGLVPGVDYSSIEGFALSLNYYNQLWAPDNPLRVRATYSTEQWQKYTAGAIFRRGGTTELHVGGGYRLRPGLRFFGIGPTSKRENASYYTDERTWAGANVHHRLNSNAFVALLGVFSSAVAREPNKQGDPSLSDGFLGDEVPSGFNEQSQGVMLRFAAVYNSTRNLGNPERGTVLGGTVGSFFSTGSDDVSFLAYRFEFQQFIPLWHSRRALGVRAYMNWIDDRGDTPVPFQRMFINEIPDEFRGFDSSRWRDLGITGITFEYRFPLLADRKDGGFGIDTVLLTDIGQVFGDIEEIRTANLTKSYGFGFRAYMAPHFLGSMEFVWSDEGFQFRLSTKQLFQFSRDVLFMGREETLIH